MLYRVYLVHALQHYEVLLLTKPPFADEDTEAYLSKVSGLFSSRSRFEFQDCQKSNKNSAYDYSVIFLPTACAGGCRLRCLTANFCEWSRFGRHCGSLESQHDVQECHCPTLLAVAMKGLCAHCGQGITVFKERQKYGYYEIK